MACRDVQPMRLMITRMLMIYRNLVCWVITVSCISYPDWYSRRVVQQHGLVVCLPDYCNAKHALNPDERVILF
jgi:hypothetical protein